MAKKKIERLDSWPEWFTGKTVNEPIFCRKFLEKHRLAYTENCFFSPNGKVTEENQLRSAIYHLLEPFVITGLSKKVDDIMKDLRIKAQVKMLLPRTDRIHVQNGTLFLNGRFVEKEQTWKVCDVPPQNQQEREEHAQAQRRACEDQEQTRGVCDVPPQNQQEREEHAQAPRRACEVTEIVRSRFPIRYNPNAKPPTRWLQFLSDLLWPEDIPTLQEFIGYCLIPSNAGQKMMVIKGSGGEGKSQIGNVLAKLFGPNAKDGSVGKISENPFARADLEHIHLMIDDDMRLEALKQTNYIKAIVTAKGKMDLERKGKQSYQGFMYARILAFSNGDLVSLYDRSDGFFRRQLILTTKRKPAGRIDDPELSEKLCEEMEGIFLWAFEGLQRLVKNSFQFTESGRAKLNREMVKKDANNIELFMESKGYIVHDLERSISSKDLYAVYCTWCEENAYPALKSKTLIEQLVANQEKHCIQYTTHLINSASRQVRGFKGIGSLIKPSGFSSGRWQLVAPDDNPFKT